jgi:circadian clock protein KaiC
VRLRYISIDGQLRKMLLVVKMRGGEHSIDMWEYTITAQGVVLGERLRGYHGLTTGIPGPAEWWPVDGSQLRSKEGEPHE